MAPHLSKEFVSNSSDNSDNVASKVVESKSKVKKSLSKGKDKRQDRKKDMGQKQKDARAPKKAPAPATSPSLFSDEDTPNDSGSSDNVASKVVRSKSKVNKPMSKKEEKEKIFKTEQATKKARVPVSSESSSSDSSDEETSDDSDDSDDVASKAIQAKLKVQKQASKREDKGHQSKKAQATKKARVPVSSEPSSSESSPLESSSSEPSSSEEEEEEEEDDDEKAPGDDDDAERAKNAPPSLLNVQRETVNPNFRPAAEFKPPKGFKPIPPTAALSPVTSKLFSNLQGKHVWHITVPRYFPVALIGEVPFEKAMKGKPFFVYKRSGYGLCSKNSGLGPHKTLLLPNKHDNAYQLAPTQISETFHFERMVDYSITEDYGKYPSAPPPPGLEWPGRKIPKHLRMRYGPFGSVDGLPATIGSSSEESEGGDAAFKTPRGSQIEKAGKKRKQTEANGSSRSRTEPPRKRWKESEKLRVPPDGKSRISKSQSQSQSQSTKKDSEQARPKKPRKESEKQPVETSHKKEPRKEEKKRKKLKKEGKAKA